MNYISGMVVKTRVASITEGKHIIQGKLKLKLHMSPYTEGTVKAVIFICAIWASFFGGSFGSAVGRGADLCNARRRRRIRTGSNPTSVLHLWTGFIRIPWKMTTYKNLECKRNETDLTFASKGNGSRLNGSRQNGSSRNGSRRNRNTPFWNLKCLILQCWCFQELQTCTFQILNTKFLFFLNVMSPYRHDET